MKITKAALRVRPSVYVFLLFSVVMGAVSYSSLPLEAEPDVEIPIILVNTLYPGVAPADMETLVTTILERELKDLKNVKEMSSTSSESVSSIKIEFETGVDMDDAYQKVRGKVDKAKVDLPAESEDPELVEINISEFPIMLVNLYGDYDMVRLKKLAEGLEEKIEQIDGVLNVDITGGEEREIQILLNPHRMAFYKIGVGQVINRIRQEHLNIPGGNLELADSKYLVRMTGEYEDVSKMADIVIKAPGGNPVKISDIGRVHDGFEDRESISRVNGKECVTLRIQKRSGENIVRIADEVKELMTQAKKTSLPQGVNYLVRSDKSKDIKVIVLDLENSIISGLILVLAVLFFFMGLRNAFFVAIAVPLSMLLSFSVLFMMGITLNMVVLFSLILALGMLVDNSIVVVENIFRHASEGMGRMQAAYEGTKEVAWPIIASTATTVAMFGPMLFWPGLMGEFMQFLPITVITTLLCSLFVALVINPVIASTFLRGGSRLFDDSGEVRGLLMRVYRGGLGWSLDHPLPVILSGVGLLVASMVATAFLGAGEEFMPTTTPETAQVTVKAPRGTQIGKTNRLSLLVEKIASSEVNVKDVITNIGLGGGSHSAVIDLEFKDREDQPEDHSSFESVAALRDKLGELSGAQYRLDVAKMGPPAGAPVEVEIFGPDYAVLFENARKIKRLLAKVDNVVDIKDDFDAGNPEIKVTVHREKAMRRKVNSAGVGQALATAVNGTKVSVLREGEDEYDIVVRYDKAYRSSINDLKDIVVTGKDDIQIPLSDVASVERVSGMGSIKHIDRNRTIKISADVQGRSSSEVLIDFKALLKREYNVPEGYQLHFAGESEEQDKAQAFLSKAFLVGLGLMFLILVTQFNSVVRPFIILSSIIMSLIGVLLGLLLTGNKFGVIMTGMGFISLAGVVVNNAIVLVDYINQLQKKRKLKIKDALLQAGLVRFRPVLMTAITTILGMLPMAMGVSIDFVNWQIDWQSSSSEWWGPMAQAIIFGLLVATVLTLVLVPVLYLSANRLSASAGKLFGKGTLQSQRNKAA
jgi:CzcA family heavy metal efflux pump